MIFTNVTLRYTVQNFPPQWGKMFKQYMISQIVHDLSWLFLSIGQGDLILIDAQSPLEIKHSSHSMSCDNSRGQLQICNK